LSVQVEIPPFLQDLTKGVTAASVNGNTVGECMAAFFRQFPQIKEFLTERNGELKGYIGIYLNGKSAYPKELDKPVKDGDTIYVFNIITGG
jgi:molybdopterin converting factor small subunit